MSGFSAEWLALREPADAAARSTTLVSFIIGGPERPVPPDRPAPHEGFQGRLLDLGGGTGSNIRYLSSRLPSPQQWTLVDDDPALLARAPAGVTTCHADLNAVIDDADVFLGAALVTASALLDLVSESWLSGLVRRCRAADAAMLFALSYDGRIVCSPADNEDEEVRRLVNEHQKRDKGFGPALGPDAAEMAVAMFAAAGYATRTAQSDWRLGPDASQLQRELVTGWAHAASEIAPPRTAAIDLWRSRRLAHIDAGRSRIVVGHTDVAGVVISHQSAVFGR
jgi:hypothetical protein